MENKEKDNFTANTRFKFDSDNLIKSSIASNLDLYLIDKFVNLKYLESLVGKLNLNKATSRGVTISFNIDEFTLHIGLKYVNKTHKLVYYLEMEKGNLLRFCTIHRHFYEKLDKDADSMEKLIYNLYNHKPYNKLYLTDVSKFVYDIYSKSLVLSNFVVDDVFNYRLKPEILNEYGLTQRDYIKLSSLVVKISNIAPFNSENIEPENVDTLSKFVNFIILNNEAVIFI